MMSKREIIKDIFINGPIGTFFAFIHLLTYVAMISPIFILSDYYGWGYITLFFVLLGFEALATVTLGLSDIAIFVWSLICFLNGTFPTLEAVLYIIALVIIGLNLIPSILCKVL